MAKDEKAVDDATKSSGAAFSKRPYFSGIISGAMVAASHYIAFRPQWLGIDNDTPAAATRGGIRF